MRSEQGPGAGAIKARMVVHDPPNPFLIIQYLPHKIGEEAVIQIFLREGSEACVEGKLTSLRQNASIPDAFPGSKVSLGS